MAMSDAKLRVVSAERRSGFSPSATRDALPGNLPVELSSFVGRKRELADVSELFAEHRLTALIGPGGCGKTRLAIRAASEADERFTDGAWWVDLAPIRDPELVGAAIAETIEVRPLPGVTHLDAAAAYLGSKSALIVLDNCEQVIDAAAAAAEALLRAGPAVAVLATSRVPTRRPGGARLAGPSSFFGCGGRRIAGILLGIGRGAPVCRACGRGQRAPEPGRRRARNDHANLLRARRHATRDRARRGAATDALAGGDRGRPGGPVPDRLARGREPRRRDCVRCGRRSSGATSCSPTISAPCFVVWPCSRVDSSSPTRRRSAPVTGSREGGTGTARLAGRPVARRRDRRLPQRTALPAARDGARLRARAPRRCG